MHYKHWSKSEVLPERYGPNSGDDLRFISL